MTKLVFVITFIILLFIILLFWAFGYFGYNAKVFTEEKEEKTEQLFIFTWKEFLDEDWIASPLKERKSTQWRLSDGSSGALTLIFIATNTEGYIEGQKYADRYTKQAEIDYNLLKPLREKWCQDFLENKVEKPENYTAIRTTKYCIEILGL